MNQISRVIVLAMAAGLANLAGCAATAEKSAEHVHTTDTTDAHAHCEMHRKMMGGKSAAQQHTMMQEHMKSMAPEMRQRMHAMHEQCK